MIRNAVGTVISRITVAATTNRTIAMLSDRTVRTGPPNSTIAATATTRPASNNGTIVKTTLPGKVSRFHDFPTTVIWYCLARRRTSRGEGGGEHGSERSCSYVSEPAEPTTLASAVPRRAELFARSFVHAAHDRIQGRHDRHRVCDEVTRHQEADRLQVDERRVVDAQAERLVGPVAHRVHRILATRRLDGGVGAPGPRPKQPGDFRHHRAIGHLVEAL